LKLAFFGDVVGRAGRKAVTQYVPRLKGELGLDAVIVNAENAAGGFGITRSTADELFDAGVDVLTLGNHSFDNPQDPFQAVEKELIAAPLGQVADAVIVDIHAEATSEKQGMGVFCDGRASLVVGTHQHVPTSDTRIWPGGTAYQTDAGMCGDYDSIIGMDKEEPLNRFTTRMRAGRFSPASGPPTLSGVFVETDNKTGLALRAEPIRMGGVLMEHVPAV